MELKVSPWLITRTTWYRLAWQRVLFRANF
jgi:hypothetical protein